MQDLNPHFSINFSTEAFPSEEQIRQFGYEPLDIYLKEDIDSESILDPRLAIHGGNHEEFISRLNEDYSLVFRYLRSDRRENDLRGEPGEGTILSNESDEMPYFQYEVVDAELEPNRDAEKAIRLVGDYVEESDVMYFKRLEYEGKETGYSAAKNFEKEISGNGFDFFPAEEGIREIHLNANRGMALLTQYRHELKAPRGSSWSDPEGGDETTIEFDYDDDAVKGLERTLDSLGFEVSSELLPPEITPPHLN